LTETTPGFHQSFRSIVQFLLQLFWVPRLVLRRGPRCRKQRQRSRHSRN